MLEIGEAGDILRSGDPPFGGTPEAEPLETWGDLVEERCGGREKPGSLNSELK